MSINLIKQRQEKVKLCLKKKFSVDTDIKARVNLVIDVSGSMSGRFKNGNVQDIVERIYPVASVFDDDKELDVYIFNNSFSRLTPVTIDNYEGYVQKRIIDTGSIGGGTNYNPVISDIVKENKGTDVPVYNIFITDGDNWDKSETTKTMIKSSNEKIFWQFVGIGYDSFDYLQKLDDLTKRVNDNADFFSVNEISDLTDEELYSKLLNEFPSFLKNYKSEKQKGLFSRLFG
jgi:uncharacterized protein with von Willebrand factor type A (vWA) domain